MKFWKKIGLGSIIFYAAFVFLALTIGSNGSVAPGAAPISGSLIGIFMLTFTFLPFSLLMASILALIEWKSKENKKFYSSIIAIIYVLMSFPIIFLSSNLAFEETAFWQENYSMLNSISKMMFGS
ncbi:hypothetical protein [Vogesella sp. LIG4]|uniref:hypothetical protein n=1 Tax=Vogesella sp. LIG4 TaxID=1192162 RepID=UPI0012FE284A|nr:hypothetical protein [Vogesella sp. LIG4]